MRENRPRHGELSALQKLKSNARSYANVYLRRGKIKRRPCSECGSAEAQMHHEDYRKPLEVTWLCRACHLRMHAETCCLANRNKEPTRVETTKRRGPSL